MTIKVTITHDQKDYPQDILVGHVNANNEPTNSGADRVLKGGETGIFWVHSHQQLTITEVPAVAK